ncbi:uncharacterized protein LOC131150512 [Malania oleifera]|uniref:uncharacterized protein LOC131150512 n=1 Tax=Malania oleifera TaxID=397392 RepID=UPI0025AEABAE|nr:uncharacterized protein LOC131150512 [Malania oleifera]
MAPSQSLKNVDPTAKAPSDTKDIPGKDDKIISVNSHENALRCTSNFEDTIFEMEAMLNEHTMAPENTKDAEVDVLESATASDIELAKDEDPDATDYSSSFGGTLSGAENCSGLSEAEVESQFCGDNDFASSFDAFSSVFQMRKKKLTSHWRNFIHPLMWRCKWTELRIKELESQTLKYATELAAYDRRKQSEPDQYVLESCGSRSLPFSCHHRRKKAMKRRKRKRVEETNDITSYMLKHDLFSYFENKKSDPDGNSMADDLGNPVVTDQNANNNDKFGFTDDHSLFEFRDSNNSLEQILWKIEMVHARVHKLRSQLEMVMVKNAGKFSSSENLSLLLPCDLQTSSPPSPTFSTGNGDAISVGAICTQHISECDFGDTFLPESAISSYGEAIHVPDIIESTVGLLSAADVTLGQPQIGDSCEDMVDDVLIHNEAPDGEQHMVLKGEQHTAPEGEQQTVENTSNQLIDKHQEQGTSEQEESTAPVSASKPVALAMAVMPEQQSTLKLCLASELHFPKNKRKRGERRAGSGGWNQKRAAELDSQT